jgi:hypothetical protein
VENVRNRNEKKDDYRNYIHMYVAFMPHDAAKEFKRLLEKGVKT